MTPIKTILNDIKELEKDTVLKLRSVDFDMNHIKGQISTCEDSILNGNWEGYSENLQVRRENLKRLRNELIELDNMEKSLIGCCDLIQTEIQFD